LEAHPSNEWTGDAFYLFQAVAMIGRTLVAFVLRRVAILALLLVLISFAVFSLLYISPGNAIDVLLGANPRTPETVRALRHQYHLDKPFLVQYWLWFKGAVRFKFGNSIQTASPVSDSIRSRLPTSLLLGCYAFVLTIISGVGLGIAAALRQRHAVDRGIVGAGIVALSTPPFVSGVLLLYVFAIVLRWFPVFGQGSGFWDQLWHLTLPAVALSLVASAYVLKHTRAAVIGVLNQDFVTFARARGLSRRRILFVYVLRNALIPVITISGLILAFLITGAVLVEVTFSLPGLGQLLVESATTKDLPMIQGVTLAIAVVIVIANLLADVAYFLVDPRVRFHRRS
jgi:peptide/nickel transport system permease protein